MKHILLLLSMLTGSALPLASLQAQDETAVATTTARALRADTELPNGPTRFIAAEGMEEVTQAVARALGGDVTTTEEAIRCGKLPSSCSLVDAVVLLRIDAPAISQNTAQVRATVWWATGIERIPVARKSMLVTLKRDAGKWVVTDQTLLEIT